MARVRQAILVQLAATLFIGFDFIASYVTLRYVTDK